MMNNAALQELERACVIGNLYYSHISYLYNNEYVYIPKKHAEAFNLPMTIKIDSEDYKIWKRHSEKFKSTVIAVRSGMTHDENLEFALFWTTGILNEAE